MFSPGDDNLERWKDGIEEIAAAPGPEPAVPLLLAAKRTDRPDILRHFKTYRGGWDIANRHYWAVSSFNATFDS